MQYSIVDKGNIHAESPIFRLDAEFFHPSILMAKRKIRDGNNATLRKLKAKIIHPMEIKREYSQEGIQILLAQNIRDNYLDFTTEVFMPREVEKSLSKNKLQNGDIAITRSGANYGQCAVYVGLPSNIFACADDLVIRVNSISSKYLSTFFNTSIGKQLIESCKYGGSQPHIAPQTLYDIPIYIPSLTSFIESIDNCLDKSIHFAQQSDLIYQKTQEFLLSELDLINWRSKHMLTFIKKYSDTEKSRRIDAEYYQPKYNEIIKSIQNYSGGWDVLGNLIDLKDKNFDPEYERQYRYIELSNISGNGEIADCMMDSGECLPSRARRKVASGDVIVSSIEGSLSSIALIEEEYDQALCSTGFYVLGQKFFNSETLKVLVRSLVGQVQLKKGCSGTILTAINKDELEKIVLPKIGKETQVQIQKKITKSLGLRKQSKYMLECAKRAVEMAIEQNEDKAIKWLGEKIKSIGAINVRKL